MALSAKLLKMIYRAFRKKKRRTQKIVWSLPLDSNLALHGQIEPKTWEEFRVLKQARTRTLPHVNTLHLLLNFGAAWLIVKLPRYYFTFHLRGEDALIQFLMKPGHKIQYCQPCLQPKIEYRGKMIGNVQSCKRRDDLTWTRHRTCRCRKNSSRLPCITVSRWSMRRYWLVESVRAVYEEFPSPFPSSASAMPSASGRNWNWSDLHQTKTRVLTKPHLQKLILYRCKHKVVRSFDLATGVNTQVVPSLDLTILLPGAPITKALPKRTEPTK